MPFLGDSSVCFWFSVTASCQFPVFRMLCREYWIVQRDLKRFGYGAPRKEVILVIRQELSLCYLFSLLLKPSACI